MYHFLNELMIKVKQKEIEDNIFECLDWLFNDKKFEYSDKNSICKFTKSIKKIDGLIQKDNYQYDTLKNLTFPKTKKSNFLMFSSGSGAESRDLIRHIRNAIAHGNAKIINNKSIHYFELRDFKKDGITQTALVIIKIEHLLKIYELFNVIIPNKNRKH